MSLTSSSLMTSFHCFLFNFFRFLPPANSFKLLFLSPLPHFILVSACARARAKRPAPASCPCLRVTLLSLPLSGTVPMWGRERERGGRDERKGARKRQRERRGAKKKDKETRERMQMQDPSRLQICKCCCLCDMQMRDYRALIRVKRTVHVN